MKMQLTNWTVLTPTIYKEEELKDVKYTFSNGYIIATHPDHPPYFIKQGTYEVVNLIEGE